jgi:hypothetical protein
VDSSEDDESGAAALLAAETKQPKLNDNIF